MSGESLRKNVAGRRPLLWTVVPKVDVLICVLGAATSRSLLLFADDGVASPSAARHVADLGSCGTISIESVDAGLTDANATDANVTDATADVIAADAITDVIATDATTNIARCFAEPGGASSLTLGAVEVEFATPNTIRLEWESTDPMDQFSEYEILLMESGQVECDVIRFDSATNPGLGYFRSPSVGHQLAAASVDGLAPGTEYVLQLIVRDQLGGQLTSTLLNARTGDAPSEEIVLFSEENTAGYSIPNDLTFTAGEGFAGSQYYEYVSTCEDGCFENLRRQDIAVSLATLSEEEFERAYYEFALASSGTGHSYWSQARLSFVQSDDSNALFIYAPFVMEAGDLYTVYQIPLRVFGRDADSTPLLYESARRGVFEFTVGGSWPLGETVRLDELRIRW